MSFSSDCKTELCRDKIERKCCALAEAYGVLLYSSCFSPSEIRICTSCEAFAARLPRLIKKPFSLSFDTLPPEKPEGKRVFSIISPEKTAVIFNAFGLDMKTGVSHHINFSMLEEDCCRLSFVRGAFLAGGSVTDPEKRFHLELSTGHASVSRELLSILLDLGFSPRESSRSAASLLYFKRADDIADFLASIGASSASLGVATAKVEKEMRNTVTRQINCDSANADKTVAAAQQQLAAIKSFVSKNGLDALPEPLRDAAFLRIANPEASLSDLARLSSPAVSKSCLSHRLNKIISLSKEVSG